MSCWNSDSSDYERSPLSPPKDLHADRFPHMTEQATQLKLVYTTSLNRLGRRCNEYLAHYLSQSLESDQTGPEQPETQIGHILATELQQALLSVQVMVVLPMVISADTALPRSLQDWLNTGEEAISESPEEPRSRIVRVACSGQGQTLYALDLRGVNWLATTQTYPLLVQQRCLGWLLLIPPTATKLLPSAIGEEPTASLIQQSLEQVSLVLEQISLIHKQRQQYQQLLIRNQELEQANHRKNQFLANTSHEIRTPLSSILGFTHLLQQQGFNPTSLRHQEYLKIILTSGQHLLALINDILDLSKIEANQLTLQWESVAVAEVCQTAVTLVREKASDKGLTLRLEIDPAVSTLVVDGLRLKQMLFNLLSNAVKFTRHGSVGLRVVVIGEFLAFTVWDTGTGISEEHQDLLFKPYSQISNDAVARGEGTGLGLVLTQKLAELHGGWIEVESQLHQGSRFTITLPLRRAVPEEASLAEPLLGDDRPKTNSVVQRVHDGDGVTVQDRDVAALVCDLPANALAPSTTEGADDAVGIRANGLLLVEDNFHNAKLILTYLSRLGYEVTWAKDGKELWLSLERSLPAAILMDINLPDTDGLTLIRQLKQDDRYCDIPVIAQTAMAMKGDRDICLQAGAEDYISKPIALDRLELLISKYLQILT